MPDSTAAVARAAGIEVRLARGAAGLSRPQLIERLRRRVPVNTLAGWETGVRAISIDRLVDVCDALSIDAGDLLTRARRRVHPTGPCPTCQGAGSVPNEEEP
ncbi:helix-turn-helix domain-containing protein [Actinophytocola sediminis]